MNVQERQFWRDPKGAFLNYDNRHPKGLAVAIACDHVDLMLSPPVGNLPGGKRRNAILAQMKVEIIDENRFSSFDRSQINKC
ncbi:hypothetical protein LP7551_02705 [Roseibium album]|nr:hypothetical protein LP7551_02705 [Roseibium album]